MRHAMRRSCISSVACAPRDWCLRQSSTRHNFCCAPVLEHAAILARSNTYHCCACNDCACRVPLGCLCFRHGGSKKEHAFDLARQHANLLDSRAAPSPKWKKCSVWTPCTHVRKDCWDTGCSLVSCCIAECKPGACRGALPAHSGSGARNSAAAVHSGPNSPKVCMHMHRTLTRRRQPSPHA